MLNKINKYVGLVLLILFSISVVSAQHDNQTQILRYSFEEGGGSVVYDVENDFDSDVFGDTSWVTDNQWGNYALDFDGNGDFTRTQSGRDTPTELTVNFWLNMDGFNKDQQIWTINDTNEVLGFYFNSTDDSMSLQYINDSNKFQEVKVIDTVDFSTNTWNMLTVELNYTRDFIYVYQNGVLEYNSTLPTNIQKVAENKSLILGVNSTGSQYYDGSLDEFRIFKGILNKTQVNQLYDDNIVTLQPLDTSTETTFPRLKKADIINYTKPGKNSTQFTPVNFIAELNIKANCDFYINQSYVKTFKDRVSISERKVLEKGNWSYRFYCYYVKDDIKYYEDTKSLDFEAVKQDKLIYFQIYENDTLTDRGDLYVHTPCFTSGLIDAAARKRFQDNKEFYIQHVEDGIAKFKLKSPEEYQFCLSRGNINPNADNFTTDYDIVDVKKQVDLGLLKIENQTTNFGITVNTADLYPKTSPNYWGITTEALLKLIVYTIIGGIVILIGYSMSSSRIMIGGVLVVLAGAGISLGSLILFLV